MHSFNHQLHHPLLVVNNVWAGVWVFKNRQKYERNI